MPSMTFAKKERSLHIHNGVFSLVRRTTRLEVGINVERDDIEVEARVLIHFYSP